MAAARLHTDSRSFGCPDPPYLQRVRGLQVDAGCVQNQADKCMHTTDIKRGVRGRQGLGGGVLQKPAPAPAHTHSPLPLYYCIYVVFSFEENALLIEFMNSENNHLHLQCMVI